MHAPAQRAGPVTTTATAIIEWSDPGMIRNNSNDELHAPAQQAGLHLSARWVPCLQCMIDAAEPEQSWCSSGV